MNSPGNAENTLKTIFRGYAVEINLKKYQELWRILAGNKVLPPKISFREKPDPPDIFRNIMLAQYRPRDNIHEIIFYPSNWHEDCFENIETFRKEFIKTLSHEIGHAVLYHFPWRSLDAFIHTKIALNPRLSLLLINLTSLAIFITLAVFISKFTPPWVNIVLALTLWAFLVLIKFTAPTYLFFKKERITDICGKNILSENKEIFDKMITISKI